MNGWRTSWYIFRSGEPAVITTKRTGKLEVWPKSCLVLPQLQISGAAHRQELGCCWFCLVLAINFMHGVLRFVQVPTLRSCQPTANLRRYLDTVPGWCFEARQNPPQRKREHSNMATIHSIFFLALLYVFHVALGLQFTPDSPCTSKCLDSSSKDASDPTSSNTTASDVVCLDLAYTTTGIGEKYQACVSCLQDSTSSNNGENDQAWFLYNLRYTLSACLFEFDNATEAEPAVCSDSDYCGHLQGAIEYKLQLESGASPYEFCGTDDNSFLGAYNEKCVNCLKSSSDEKYLANFMIALQAGCVQKPPSGTLIGLDGTVFSTNFVNITFPGDDHTKSGSGLSRSGIIGISISGGIVLIMASVSFFVCFRKHREKKRLKGLKSPLDSRFGAPNISTPTNGAYGSPYPSPSHKEEAKFDLSNLSPKERHVLGLQPVASVDITEPRSHLKTWEALHSNTDHYSPPGMPSHHAYNSRISASGTELSRITGIDSNGTYQQSVQSSPNTSPQPFMAPSPPESTPNSEGSQPGRSLTAPRHGIGLPSGPSSFKLQLSGNASSPTQSPYTSPHMQPQSAPSRTQLPPNQVANPGPPPRFHSRAGMRRVITKFSGTATSTHNSISPLQISGPIVKHGDRRFEYELGERERRLPDRSQIQKMSKAHGRVETPQSTESDEQWPGSY
ncbi:hypothetical protein BJ878DRAFT_574210 [Calycina marina]|uniref:LPXTG-domain-containing protein n=1 Tax=Calycina marina TaxID=1763456 RepID=A0A9P7Z777_9HELO|nr:hypothetical protein BJ878DRAFT_574210 [Calycina marina]